MSSIVMQSATKTWASTGRSIVADLSIEAGELMVIVGPSGCGKSTTLRMIAGLDPLDSGQVVIGGQDVTGTDPGKRGVAMVFQSYALFPHLTVRRNITFGLEVRGVTAQERQSRLNTVAEMLHLEELLDRRPSQLSGGQQQRVALARALVAKVAVCLMDEPLSNLDAQLRVEMRREIRAIQRELRLTLVYVTHDQAEASSMADRVAVMEAGRIVQVGAPGDLYRSPASAFVAGFLGTPPMNLLKASTLRGIDARLDSELAHSDAATVGVRAEHMRLEPSSSVASPHLEAVVAEVEFLADELLVTCKLPSGEHMVLRTREPGPAVASSVRLAWDPARALLFDTAGRHIAQRALS